MTQSDRTSGPDSSADERDSDGDSRTSLARDETVAARIKRLKLASPLYARHLENHPEYLKWLETPRIRNEEFRFPALLESWRGFLSKPEGDVSKDAHYLSELRRFRRKITLRIAYRSVNELTDEATTVRELTALADFCVRECYLLAFRHWRDRWGEPRDSELDRPARFCVLALGKMGGHELNFSSDIDLIYIYEGDGPCRRDGEDTNRTSAELFTKVGESLTRHLEEPSADGRMYRVDLRLRPEGAQGSLVCSFAGMENYYAAAGQTWERMALIKARPVAGDLGLGGELLESLHAFRYPRHPPPSLLQEVAAMKTRTEKEIVGARSLDRNIKSGFGGIREIEFLVQSFQLLHGGRNPFLQTGSTVEALEQLLRYDFLPSRQVRQFTEAYWFLRTVENRLQMREEQQTHELPESPELLEEMALSLGFANREALESRLADIRQRVRDGYVSVFGEHDGDDPFADWWKFLTTDETPESLAPVIDEWLHDAGDAARQLRLFARGDPGHQVSREQVLRFLSVVETFDDVMPRLARPTKTLQRIARIADRYGTRHQFYNACSSNPDLFRVLALLFDRSHFIFQVLLQHPEILEEVLRPEILRKTKTRGALSRELAAGGDATDPRAWLLLYVRAEQIRHAIGELLGFNTSEETELGLTRLADAVIAHFLTLHDPAGVLAAVGLGKLGGGEMTYGSDLDLLFVADPERLESAENIVRRIQKECGARDSLGPLLEIDLRLRPHGEAGPLVTTLASLEDYHGGTSAQAWERQMLTRARGIAGSGELLDAFEKWRQRLLFTKPANAMTLQDSWNMRRRIERERDQVSPPERAFKTGAGGLIDFEFTAQLLQMKFGCEKPHLREPGTRTTLSNLQLEPWLSAADHKELLENYEFLKAIEVNLRRDKFKPVSVIAEGPEALATLARWLGAGDANELWKDHVRRLSETRAIIARLLEQELGLPVRDA